MHNTFIPLTNYSSTLSPTQLDIWQFSLNTPISDLEITILSSDEIERANRYYFERHRRRFIVARVRLRQILARYLSLDPMKICFDYNEQGKPMIKAPSTNLQFNLTHSKESGLLALCHHHPVGIDIEFFSARPFIGIGKQLFSDAEIQALKKLPSYLLPAAFFHIWSQKEALIKAIGLGLSYPTKAVDLPIIPPSQTELIEPIYQTHWKISSFSPALACAAAVCHHPDITQIHYGIL
jgi:4'-phosphopantetheinyl transferase